MIKMLQRLAVSAIFAVLFCFVINSLNFTSWLWVTAVILVAQLIYGHFRRPRPI